MTETIYLLPLQMVRERYSHVTFYTSLVLHNAFFPQELAFPLIQLISAAESSVQTLVPYILAMNLTFPLPILLSPGPELMTPLQNYVMLPIFEYLHFACKCFLTAAGKCSKTLQRPHLFLLKLGKYLRLRRFACVFG